jgi:hypothetical protein
MVIRLLLIEVVHRTRWQCLQMAHLRRSANGSGREAVIRLNKARQTSDCSKATFEPFPKIQMGFSSLFEII